MVPRLLRRLVCTSNHRRQLEKFRTFQMKRNTLFSNLLLLQFGVLPGKLAAEGADGGQVGALEVTAVATT